MKCPKCGFVQADLNDSCKKCGKDLVSFKTKLEISTKYPPGKTSRLKSPIRKFTTEKDRLSFEQSRLQIEREKLARTGPREDLGKLAKERERIQNEREKLRSERIAIEAKHELERRRFEKEKQRGEKQKIQHEREKVRLEKIRLDAKREKQRQKAIEVELQKEELALKKEMEELELRKARDETAALRVAKEKEKLLLEQKEIERKREAREEYLATLKKEKEEFHRKKSQAPTWEKGAKAREDLDQTVSLRGGKGDFPPESVPLSQQTTLVDPPVQKPDQFDPDITTQRIQGHLKQEIKAPAETLKKPEEEMDLVVVGKGGFIKRMVAGSIDMVVIAMGL